MLPNEVTTAKPKHYVHVSRGHPTTVHGHQYSYALFDDGSATVQPHSFKTSPKPRLSSTTVQPKKYTFSQENPTTVQPKLLKTTAQPLKYTYGIFDNNVQTTVQSPGVQTTVQSPKKLIQTTVQSPKKYFESTTESPAKKYTFAIKPKRYHS